VSYHSNHL